MTRIKETTVPPYDDLEKNGTDNTAGHKTMHSDADFDLANK